MSVRVNAKNIGVAPMYKDWAVQFALLNSANEPVATAPANFKLSTVKPGEAFALAGNLSPNNLTPGTYRLAVRLIQPNADVAKTERWKLDARNTYILFANDLPTVNGTWGTDNGLKGGWSVLGSVALR
ncbi:MAG: DUF4832 domain-containing protein, partial [Burkholderiaceae bacterium]